MMDGKYFSQEPEPLSQALFPRGEVGGTLTLAHLKTSVSQQRELVGSQPASCLLPQPGAGRASCTRHWVVMDESGFSRLDVKGWKRGAAD